MRSSARDLDDLVSPLVPDDVVVVEGPIAEESPAHWPEETALVEHASLKRRAEFNCGRLYAHRAIQKLGLDDCPVLAGEDRVPVWPSGLVGSISHSPGHCAAAVARASRICGIGIDVEQVDRFRSDHARQLMSFREIDANLRGLSHQRQLARTAVIFSAKESLYKCLYPLTQAPLEFHDVEVVLQGNSSIFEVALQIPAGRFEAGCRLVGRYGIKAGHVATAVIISNVMPQTTSETEVSASWSR